MTLGNTGDQTYTYTTEVPSSQATYTYTTDVSGPQTFTYTTEGAPGASGPFQYVAEPAQAPMTVITGYAQESKPKEEVRKNAEISFAFFVPLGVNV